MQLHQSGLISREVLRKSAGSLMNAVAFNGNGFDRILRGACYFGRAIRSNPTRHLSYELAQWLANTVQSGFCAFISNSVRCAISPSEQTSIVPTMIEISISSNYRLDSRVDPHRTTGWLSRFLQPDLVGFRWVAAEESAGMEWTSWIHPEDVENFVQKWRESIGTGERLEGAAECGGLMANIVGCCTMDAGLGARDGGTLKWHALPVSSKSDVRQLMVHAIFALEFTFEIPASHAGLAGSLAINPWTTREPHP
jgi:hypothetical protein